MPSSNLELAPQLIHLVHTTKRKRRILDVGPGHGKYGVLLREYTTGSDRLGAIEAWKPYVDAFNLLCMYDEVFAVDVRDFDLLHEYDVKLMIVVLDHLHRQDGEQLLRRIPGTVIVYCDTTIAFPLFCEYVVASERGRRPRKGLVHRRDELVADLERQARAATAQPAEPQAKPELMPDLERHR